MNVKSAGILQTYIERDIRTLRSIENLQTFSRFLSFRITDTGTLSTYYLFGALFENLVISEIVKLQIHNGRRKSVYYWRESNGVELDCIIEREKGEVTALEIKAGQTFSRDYVKNLLHFPKEILGKEINKVVIYGGSETTRIDNIKVISWCNFVENCSELI